jgi:TonB family protein
MAAAPGGAATAGPLREQLETERLQTQYLAAASPASELNLLEAPAAVYPPDALRQNIHGWVELEFVVDRTGRPKNPAVVAAEPIGRFDQAALAAVAKYRYAPFVRGLHVYERRVRLRLRFALN